jgi:hypothetical protein
MKPRISTIAISILALAALGACAFGQTVRSLAYNTTNFTVQGWTNTNALKFTNNVEIGNNVLTTNTNTWIITINAAGEVSQGLAAEFFLPESTAVRGGIGAAFHVGGFGGEGGALYMGDWFITADTNFTGASTTAKIFGALDFGNSTNKAVTRTNLFGHGGITTNISVLVPGGGTNTLRFTNGILFSNSVP